MKLFKKWYLRKNIYIFICFIKYILFKLMIKILFIKSY